MAKSLGLPSSPTPRREIGARKKKVIGRMMIKGVVGEVSGRRSGGGKRKVEKKGRMKGGYGQGKSFK